MSFYSVLGSIGTNIASGLLEKGLKYGKELLSSSKSGMSDKIMKIRGKL